VALARFVERRVTRQDEGRLKEVSPEDEAGKEEGA
jgi:hypothetical protein